MSADLLVDEYLAHLKIERGLSPATVSAYASDLARWTTFLAATNVEAPDADAGAIAVERAHEYWRRSSASPAFVDAVLNAQEELEAEEEDVDEATSEEDEDVAAED